MEACVPRFATRVLDGEIGAHLTHTAVDTRASISVIMPGYACFYACRLFRRRIAGQDAPWEARTPDLEVSSLTL